MAYDAPRVPVHGRAPTLALLLTLAALAGCLSEQGPGPSGPPVDSPTASPGPPSGPTPEPTEGPPPDPSPSPSPSPSPDQTPSPTASPGPDTNATPGPGSGPPAGPEPWVWPDLADATIRPGVQMVADGSQCTSNFVFLDPQNTTAYLGFAAHCVGAGDDSTNTDGCSPQNPSLPLGTLVEVEGASRTARLVYSSWETMQRLGEGNADACAYNDFAVVALDPTDAPKAHPAMLTYGGPTGMAGPVGVGDKVLTFGDSGLRPGPSQLDAREGYVLFDSAWTTTVYTASPGLPGDSGSGVLTGDGAALGVLVTVGLAPYTASNGVTHLDKAMAYAAGHSGPELVLGTWDLLDPGLLP